MKVPYYETSAGATVALLLTKQFVKIDLYTIILANGAGVLRFTTGLIDVTIPAGPTTWKANTVDFGLPGGGSVTGHWKVGLDVDTWQVATTPRPVDLAGTTYPDLINSQPWLPAIRAGALDGAEIQVDRAFFAAHPAGNVPSSVSPTGVITLFYGRVAEVDITRTQAILSINSHLEMLSNMFPRNNWQTACRYTLFDAGCALTAGSFAAAGTAAAGSTQQQINTAITTPSPLTYQLGRLVMTSGQNAGFGRTIRDFASGLWFRLIAPLPFPVATGDAFTIYPGCDKTLAMCGNFSNTANYGGEPYVPDPETAV